VNRWTVHGASSSAGRAIAHRRLVAGFPPRRPGFKNPGLVMKDFVMDKSGAGAGFLRELRFPLPIYIPSASPQSSSLSPEASTIG
jgi:hypothetical protein